VTYAHPLLEPILKDTLGVILYQEQIIEIAMYVAGMTPSGADGFRRAMTRHLTGSMMSSLEGDFINGCLGNGVPREVADQRSPPSRIRRVWVLPLTRRRVRSHVIRNACSSSNTPSSSGAASSTTSRWLLPPSVLVEDLSATGDSAAGGRQTAPTCAAYQSSTRNRPISPPVPAPAGLLHARKHAGAAHRCK